ncbi:MAG: DEAD/DEAH box helicase [Planctomycetaceae bacterium]|jgi:DNA repair protein RadD|nr:DEAD/DEAH box helicase [Planctomycetaceae bacterium]
MFELRHYQRAAVDAVYNYLRNEKGNPCVVLPTAAGKTLVIATICRDAVMRWNGRVLVLAHVKELLQQSADKLQTLAPNIPVGVYSAGLKSRETDKQIIVAGIQSVYKRACELDKFDLIIVDECHLLPTDGEGMYQTFLKESKVVNPIVRLIGLTATPYRMKSGMLCGNDNLLNNICYEIGIRDLIEQGFLCPLKSKSGRKKIDYSGLHLQGGEFIVTEMETLINTEDNVESACREIVAKTQDRHSILIFAVSVNHAKRVKETIERITNLECGIVTGDTPSNERDLILRRFKGETIAENLFGGESQALKYLVNVNVLTTGFDAPNIDCVVLLRPTNSAGLYYQMVGRGFRLHESKSDCLVLDYGGNILRHGPVDAIQIKDKQSGDGDAPVKECPQCQTFVHAAYAACPECGFEFPLQKNDNLESIASGEGILTGEIIDTEYEVNKIFYSVHSKQGADESTPKTLRIDYEIGLNKYKSEWVCPEHSGWARKKFEKWWIERSNDPTPDTAEQAARIGNAGGIADTKRIIVRKIAGEKFDRIIKRFLAEKPYAVSDYLETEIDSTKRDPFEINFDLNDDVPF